VAEREIKLTKDSIMAKCLHGEQVTPEAMYITVRWELTIYIAKK